MRSLFIPLQMAAEAKGLKLNTNLDPNIDIVARCAAYKALGERPETITKHLEQHPNVSGVVIGDEARLRQIVTNLAR
jgi:osomolarity two-component system, sensor histidine kinase SLN1